MVLMTYMKFPQNGEIVIDTEKESVSERVRKIKQYLLLIENFITNRCSK